MVIIWAVFASIMHITLLCFPFYPEVYLRNNVVCLPLKWLNMCGQK